MTYRRTSPVRYARREQGRAVQRYRSVPVDPQIHIKLRNVTAEIAQEGGAVIEDAAVQRRNLSSTIPAYAGSSITASQGHRR